MSDVLVGIDPRELSVPALVWAADAAVRRGVRLRLVSAVPPARDRLPYAASSHRSSLRVRAESALATAEDLVRELYDGLWTATELVDGNPAAVLRGKTRGAALAVVGSRPPGRPADVPGGDSVGVPLASLAHCPVVVVRAPEQTAVHPPLIVVGVDGSTHCRAAFAFAAAEARLRGALLLAVWVRPRPLPAHGDGSDEAADHRRLLAEAITGPTARFPEVDVDRAVLRGHPVEELTRASREALAVVVGRRGRGGFTGMDLGSTAHGLLHHATCPVITVPLPEEGGRDGPPPTTGSHRSQTDRLAPTDRPAPTGGPALRDGAASTGRPAPADSRHGPFGPPARPHRALSPRSAEG
ncbi:universal stress protein [Streptomyces sp. NPDC048330]|uniref:universal stress protein n=1 Tax=Streptomyces sp. NPDC048330 TaxID=3365533 RepID=UPI0037167694